MTGLKPVAVNAASHGMNSPSSIITNHIYGCYSSMNLKTSYAASNGTVLAKSNLRNPTMRKRKGFKVGWLECTEFHLQEHPYCFHNSLNSGDGNAPPFWSMAILILAQTHFAAILCASATSASSAS